MNTRLPWELHGVGTPNCGGAGPHDVVIVGDRTPGEDHDPADDRDSVVVVAHVKGNATAGRIPTANAELIVTAVNNHAALLAALDGLIEAVVKDSEEKGISGFTGARLADAREAVRKARG